MVYLTKHIKILMEFKKYWRFSNRLSLCSAGYAWWLVLICCERKVLLVGWCWWLMLIWCERRWLMLI